MKYKVIACNVFKHEIEYFVKHAEHKLDIEFLELGEHAHPDSLRTKLQQKIDSAREYDAVLLCYGLCGRATDGLTAKHCPLVIPRSHDCCGILLGSRKRFEEFFRPMPSTPFSSIGFIEYGNYYFQDGETLYGDAFAALVEQYGEDDAKYVWDAMHPKLNGVLQPIYFISAPEIPCCEAREKCRGQAGKEGREFRELEGNLRLVKMLLSGDWPSDEFLTLQPGDTICQTGDWDVILSRSCEKTDGASS